MSAENRKKTRDAIKELGKAGAYEIHLGTVESVNEGATTMTVDVTGLIFYDVRLRAVVTNDTGVWVKPKVGSKVIIAQIEGGVDCFLVQPSEVDKVFIKIGSKTLVIEESKLLATYGNTTLELNNDFAKIQSGSKKINISNTAIVMNNGSNGGLVKSVTTASKLNALEAQENALKTIVTSILSAGSLSPGTPVTNGTLAALFAAFNIIPLTPTTNIMLENPDATH